MSRQSPPPDPRRELAGRRERRLRQDQREPIPWLWLGLGVVVTIVGIGLALALVNAFLSREPIAATLPTPTIIRLTAPPTSPPTETPLRSTPTSIPTFTPVPTPDRSIAPEVVTVGYFATVVNTDGIGVSLRGGPSTDNIRLLTIPESEVVLVIDGPQENGDFLWWQVRRMDGNQTEGWVAGDFLAPSIAPEGAPPGPG